MISHNADLGIAWDGDCDRCFFFDEKGSFIEGYYLVGLFAQEFLKDNPGSKVVHDPRLVWNTQEMVRNAGGVPVMSKAGHAFIKERMRLEDADLRRRNVRASLFPGFRLLRQWDDPLAAVDSNSQRGENGHYRN